MSDTPPSDEGLDDLIRELIDDPTSLGQREAWESYIFTPNITNGRPTPSGRWRRGNNSTEVATVRLFGWVHSESMLGTYGSMEHTRARWFTPANMARTQKQILVLCLPSDIPPRSAAARYMNIQARNAYYVLRTKAGLPDLDWVMEDESREVAPQNRTHWWITSAGSSTYINLTSKLWQDVDGKGKMGGSLPRNLYGQQASSAPDFDHYTMATWPNPKNYDYANDPAALNYQLAPLDAFDENDNRISRANFQTALRPGTAVVVDVTMALWRIKDTPKDDPSNAPETVTDTFQLIMQQIKVVKPMPNPFEGAVFMDDLGPDLVPPPIPSRKRRAATPTLELSPPTKRPLPSTPSKIRSCAPKIKSGSPPDYASVAGPSSSRVAGPSSAGSSSAHAAHAELPSMMMSPALHPTSARPDRSPEDDYLLIYDLEEQPDETMDASSSKTKHKNKGKGKGKAK
ncbi:hypothetical protein M407DRAFT_23046 [Tulasnella calospora MUT 4182]|uniref:Uncharacterized protein n=1 Tax=Tulasnella calospora MUT 4182 TaxID=1051891 RepID=A0A0C3QLX4_9AGAM|nr:hypothetical protein M407DRAFT_23046 [Tulasnella calospora MUT 4182]